MIKELKYMPVYDKSLRNKKRASQVNAGSYQNAQYPQAMGTDGRQYMFVPVASGYQQLAYHKGMSTMVNEEIIDIMTKQSRQGGSFSGTNYGKRSGAGQSSHSPSRRNCSLEHGRSQVSKKTTNL